jgi:hypothetical protein
MKCNLRDQPRLQPSDVLLTRWIDERRAAAKEWAERFREVGERLLGKTGADFADKNEIFATIGSKQKCPEMLP